MNPAEGPVLRDIHLPLEPSWWPPAPGWWLLALLLLLAMAWTIRQLRRLRRAARARAQLLVEFDDARARHPSATAGAEQVAALSLLLRRAAQRYAPQALLLRDEDWLAFLDAGNAERPFRNGPGRLLLDGPYRARLDAAPVDALADVVRVRLVRFVSRSDA